MNSFYKLSTIILLTLLCSVLYGLDHIIVETDNDSPMADLADCTHPDYAALMALYDATGGPDWWSKEQSSMLISMGVKIRSNTKLKQRQWHVSPKFQPLYPCGR